MTTTTPSSASTTGPSAKNIDVQLLTQKDFDAMTPTRQAFIRDRIAAGQVKIVSAEDITPTPPPKQPVGSVDLKKLQKSIKTPSSNKPSSHPPVGSAPPRPRYPPNPPASSIPTFLGKQVHLILTNGQNRSGILTNIYQYDIILETSQGPVIILKHAIVLIELTQPSNPSIQTTITAETPNTPEIITTPSTECTTAAELLPE